MRGFFMRIARAHQRDSFQMKRKFNLDVEIDADHPHAAIAELQSVVAQLLRINFPVSASVSLEHCVGSASIELVAEHKAKPPQCGDHVPFSVNGGSVFIKDAFVKPASFSASMSLGVERGEKTIRDKVRDIVAPYMTGEATEFTDELVDEVMNLFDKPETRRLIDSCITESIRLHCRPGGLIWQTLRR
ncbi:hypothetical protein CEP66_15750 [Citrobacter koseri]|uniref:Uncharacterized protein n=2 Tax=Citrobacter koseri TaxID=545 RepID=A0AAQ0V9H1_CITKO|nr:hypothetical protein CEP66_15750 [Citrobacter koseri]OFV11219.1 hypothetical protein HMPREF3126_14800 [Salmonella sp. HMSC13B08]ATF98199.1 hypothetical protein CO700_14690 [Citrobacter koseri]AVE69419.1 hypothetical protein AM351_17190 [Citrobacter koseri]KXA01281.1 hypothetical protein HMPREF3220_01618 [Citrobacter koseri]